MHIRNWKPCEKATLRGFFSIVSSRGLIIHSIQLHERNGEKWITLPAREYRDARGEKQYSRFIDFIDDETRNRFQTSVLESLNNYFTEAANERQTERQAQRP